MVDADPIDEVVDVVAESLDRRVGVELAVGATKVTAKLTPTTPPVSPTASSCSSSRLRVDGQSACAFECVATTGASVASATSKKPRRFRCEQSTRIPRALQARDERTAGVGEAGAGVGRARERERDAVRERVRARPDEPDRADAERVPLVEVGEVGLERVGALEVQDRRDASRLEVLPERAASRRAGRSPQRSRARCAARRRDRARGGSGSEYGIGGGSSGSGSPGTKTAKKPPAKPLRAPARGRGAAAPRRARAAAAGRCGRRGSAA